MRMWWTPPETSTCNCAVTRWWAIPIQWMPRRCWPCKPPWRDLRMEVHWLEQADADVPTGNDWLGAAEALRLSDMRFANRRADWRLGRWTAKRALSIYGNRPSDPASLAAIEILPAASGAPEVLVANQPAAVTISISHRAHVAFCAVAAPVVALGCDLEVIEPRSDAFAADYFTAQEQHLLR